VYAKREEYGCIKVGYVQYKKYEEAGAIKCEVNKLMRGLWPH